MESVVIALLYLERIENYTFRGFVNPITLNRLFLTGLLIASKYFDDVAFPNTVYCKIVGMDFEELRVLEVEFLVHLRFHLYISESEFFNTHQRLELPMYEGKSTLYYSVTKEKHSTIFDGRADTKQLVERRIANRKIMTHDNEHDSMRMSVS